MYLSPGQTRPIAKIVRILGKVRSVANQMDCVYNCSTWITSTRGGYGKNSFTIAGADGDDAQRYLEAAVRKILQQLQEVQQ